jgi:thioredoxin 1
MTLQPYTSDHPSRAMVEAMPGNVVIEFGVDWCPHCQQAAGPVSMALAAAGAPLNLGVAAAANTLQYLRLEDERVRPLGRSFKVKLWPTLLFLRDGVEVARVVRPTTAAEVMAGLEQLGSNKEVWP